MKYNHLVWWFRYRVLLLPRDIKQQITHRYQRAKQGWSFQDVWSLDTYLASVLVGSLTSLRDKPAFPGQFDTQEEWQAILDEMIEGFDLWAARWSPDSEDHDYVKVERSLELLKEYFGCLWW